MEPVPATALGESAIARAFHDKAKGACLLDAQSRALELDFFVLFSSASAIMGSRDLAHFGAANHLLDILAHSRRERGLAATCINWGWWPDGGTAESLDDYYPKIGLDPLTTADAFNELAACMRSARTQTCVSAIDWGVFKRVCEARGPVPFLAAIREEGQPAEDTEKRDTDFQHTWERTPKDDRWGVIVSHVREHLSRVLGFTGQDEMDNHEGFFQMGMDSITALQFTDRLQKGLGQSLPATLTFEYPNIDSLCRHLMEDVLGAATDGSANPTAARPEVERPAKECEDEHQDSGEDELVMLLAKKLKSLEG